MSAIDSATGSGGVQSSTNAFSGITSEEFLKVLFSELTNQDPLQPNDTAAILEQISTIRSIETDLSLQTSIESLVSQNEFASAGAMIGKLVSGLTEDGRVLQGVVSSVVNSRNGAFLKYGDGSGVLLKDVLEIRDAPAAGAPVVVGGDEESEAA